MSARGFTLVELLVVLVVVGVMATMATLAIGNNGSDRLLALEAKRLATLMTLAEQEAVLRGEVMGLELVQQGYRFLTLGDAGWQVVADDMTFRDRQLTGDMRLGLSIADEAEMLRGGSSFSNPARPQVVLAPDSVAEVIRIRLDDRQRSFSISNDGEQGWTLQNLPV